MTFSVTFPPTDEPPEIISVESAKVSCAGSDEASAHPKVYLKIDERGFVDCPYCGCRYQLKSKPKKNAKKSKAS